MKTLHHPIHFLWQNVSTIPRRLLDLVYDLRYWSIVTGSLILAILLIMLAMALQAH